MELSVSSVSVVTLLLSTFVHTDRPQKSGRTVPRIVPSKLWLFEYSPLTVTCDGFFQHSPDWRVVRIANGNIVPCNKSDTFGPCHIQTVYPAHSGEYWCESTDQRRSESIHITVTVGGVVLESPVHPVMVGDTVTLRCITKENASTEFSFYKDGVKLKSSSDGEMTIHNISESDQGRYKCSTSDAQFSEDNLLQVKAVLLQSPDRPVMEGTNVTLVCSDKMAALNHTTVFYKDGVDVGDSSSGRLTLTVSKSDEGVYKCSSSEGRESEEQWLSVTTGTKGNVTTESSTPVDYDDFSFIIISLTTGLGGLTLVLLIIMMKTTDVSDDCIKETAVYQVTTIKDDEKTERSSFSQNDRGSACDSVMQREIYTAIVYSGKSKDV